MSERLEEIITKRYENRGLNKFEIDWVVEYAKEQAERLQGLEEEKESLHHLIDKTARISWDIEQQNKRYRAIINAMGQILKDAIHSLDVGEKVQGLEYGVAMRNEALVGESDERAIGRDRRMARI